MRGVQYVVDHEGKPQAVVIDLKKNRRLWEDFFDACVAQERRKEPRDSWKAVEARLRKAGKLK